MAVLESAEGPKASGGSEKSSPRLPAEIDVLIVGFGPVGATIANLLGLYGVKALVVDKATEIFMAPRAIALDNEALRVLQLAGLEEGDVDRIAIPFVRMLSPSLGEFGRINTLGEIDGHPKLVTFYQPQLEEVLRRKLSRYESVRRRARRDAHRPRRGGRSGPLALDLGEGRTASTSRPLRDRRRRGRLAGAPADRPTVRGRDLCRGLARRRRQGREDDGSITSSSSATIADPFRTCRRRAAASAGNS